MKLFPILFLLLFVKNKLWKQIIINLLLVIFITFFSIFVLGLDMESYLLLLSNNSKFYTENYVIADGGLDFGHSLFGLIKGFFLFLDSRHLVPQLLTPYFVFVIIVFIYFSYFIVFKEKSLWKNSTIIVILFCLLPNVSADYKLIHFLIPILLYINHVSSFEEIKQKTKVFNFNIDFLYILLFSTLLVPKNYRFFLDIYDGVIIDPVVMVIFLFLFVVKSKESNYNY
jgi:hypothetical protein